MERLAGKERDVLVVEAAGLQTTVQDLGRPGYRRYGVPVSGAMDAAALRRANGLLGQAAGLAGLEVTLEGLRVRFLRATRCALTGADLEARLDGELVGTERVVDVVAGSTLAFGRARWGCRAYLAVAGGFEVPRVMGSRSTCLPAGFGGYAGRALRAGDVLASGGEEAPVAGEGGADGAVVDDLQAPIRIHAGPEHQWFGLAAYQRLLAMPYRVTEQSNRVGYRLAGEPLTPWHRGSLLSSATMPGVIQVPPDGQPIVLMADAPTVGGYPRIGVVDSADLPRLGQRRPGDLLRFVEVG